MRGTAAVIPATIGLQMLMGRATVFAQGTDFKDDVEVLNYALTLEYLESEFYRQGNSAGLLSGVEADYAKQIGADEDAHVTAITQTIKDIGGKPVAAPKVDFGKAFSDRGAFLKTAHTFENLGVGAYLGAASFIKEPAILQAAAGIFGVEARHAAVIGDLMGLEPEGGVYMGATETPIKKDDVLKAAGPFIKG